MLGRLRRILPPVALLAGLFFFGVSLLVLGTQATEDGTYALQPSALTTANGTAVLVYPVHYHGYRMERIDVAFTFPSTPGNAYFVGCDDIELLRAGDAPTAPMLAFTTLRNWTFVVSSQTAPARLYYSVDDAARDRGYRECDPAVVFTWDAPDGDPTLNQPTVNAQYFYASLDGEGFVLLTFLMAGSALATLLGGLAWARARWRAADPPSPDDSTVEALRATLDRMGEQLERTRKHLLLGGFFGVFLWYPFLLPWVWQLAARSSTNPLIPWAVALGTFLFLAALTALWAREFLRLDRELNAWRGRIGELRDREETLLDSLERGGG